MVVVVVVAVAPEPHDYYGHFRTVLGCNPVVASTITEEADTKLLHDRA